MFADPPPLATKRNLYSVPFRGVEVDLGGEIRPRVDLLVHVEGDRLRVPEVLLRVRLVDALGEVLLVAGAGPHLLPLLPDDRRGPRVLAEREDEVRRHLGVAQQRDRHPAVVGGRLGVGRGSRRPSRCARGAGGRRRRASPGSPGTRAPPGRPSASPSRRTSRPRRAPSSGGGTWRRPSPAETGPGTKIPASGGSFRRWDEGGGKTSRR